MAKNMENIKLPGYAVQLGNGTFAGVFYKWTCSKCGKYVTGGQPAPNWCGGCPEGGNHVWIRSEI